jgi:hypothetical protein
MVATWVSFHAHQALAARCRTSGSGSCSSRSYAAGDVPLSFGFGDDRQESVVGLGEDPSHRTGDPLRLPEGGVVDDTHQDQLTDHLGMCPGVCERQHAAPRTTPHQPSVDAEKVSNPLTVADDRAVVADGAVVRRNRLYRHRRR